MRYSCRNSVEYDLKCHYGLLDKYTNEMGRLSMYDGYVLKPTKIRGTKRYYSAKGPGMTGFNYLGSEENDQVRLIREHAFYSKSVEIIRSNISVMEEFLRIFKSTRTEHIYFETLGFSD